MSNEAWYDTEIAPVLMELAEKCQAKRVPFIAVVEYAHNQRAGTYFVPPEAGLSQRLVYLCAKTAPNVDAFVIEAKRYCTKHGIDTSGSAVMG